MYKQDCGQLFLQGMGLINIPYDKIPPVRQLYLENNNITEVDFDKLPNILEILYLGNNNINKFINFEKVNRNLLIKIDKLPNHTYGNKYIKCMDLNYKTIQQYYKKIDKCKNITFDEYCEECNDCEFKKVIFTKYKYLNKLKNVKINELCLNGLEINNNQLDEIMKIMEGNNITYDILNLSNNNLIYGDDIKNNNKIIKKGNLYKKNENEYYDDNMEFILKDGILTIKNIETYFYPDIFQEIYNKNINNITEIEIYNCRDCVKIYGFLYKLTINDSHVRLDANLELINLYTNTSIYEKCKNLHLDDKNRVLINRNLKCKNLYTNSKEIYMDKNNIEKIYLAKNSDVKVDIDELSDTIIYANNSNIEVEYRNNIITNNIINYKSIKDITYRYGEAKLRYGSYNDRNGIITYNSDIDSYGDSDIDSYSDSESDSESDSYIEPEIINTDIIMYEYNILNTDECGICLETDIDLRKTKCGHVFHKHCLDQWLTNKLKKECPICKHILYSL